MKGDFTRCEFDTKRHFRSVRMQQGRVLLDSDWNSQMEIESHLSRARTIDAVGLCAGPLQNAGFAVISNGEDIKKCKDSSILAGDKPLEDMINSLPTGDFLITRGRYYVDGILCENDDHVISSQQKDFPKSLDLEDGKDYLIYLDVWERHITCIEDPDIREVALGGPDTTTRVQTVWQVKAKERDEQSGDLDCKNAALWHPDDSNGMLSVHLGLLGAGEDKCKVEDVSRYTGLDNRLYRVEIHRGGIVPQENSEESEQPTATFKWSKDNGSSVFAVETILPRSARIGIGRDPLSILKSGDWVEIFGDKTELSGEPGKLVKIKDINAPDRIVTFSEDVDEFKDEEHIKIRKWDNENDSGDKHGERDIIIGQPFELEDGIYVVFSGDRFRTGDYWTFRARTLTGSVDPIIGMPPQGIAHHYCPLGMISYSEGKISLIEDCRRIYLSLTELTELVDQIEGRTELSYVGGSGQEGCRGEALRHPLQVGVSSLDGPVSNVYVRFEVEGGGGSLRRMGEGGNYASFVEVMTGDDGIAGCCWMLGEEGTQMIKAALRDKKDLPVVFYADFMEDPDRRLRMEVSKYGMVVAAIGILASLVGMTHVAMKWFAVSMLIAFVAMLVVSFLLKKGHWK